MDRVTTNRYRVGSHTATATVHHMQVLPADTDRGGNLGGEVLVDGAWRHVDDEFDTRRLPNAGLARSWAQRRARALAGHPGVLLADARVEVERWDADDYDDPTYGNILDAAPVVETEQHGTIADDGTITWDDPEPVVTR